MNDEEQKAYFLRKKRWTEAEKRILLKGLKKYGSKSIDKLKTCLPNKSVASITQMINKYRAIAELGKKDVYSPLDVWLRSGIFHDENSLLSQALLFIYLFENHPSPEETAGFDLKSMYKFLFEASTGHRLTNLPQKTVEMLKELIFQVDKELWPANELSTTDFLIGKLSSVASEKCYKRRRTC